MSDQNMGAMRAAAIDPAIRELRYQLASWAASVLTKVADQLQLAGDLIGGARAQGTSPFGHGSDETVAMSLLLHIAAELASASADLLNNGRTYAGSALVRQIVEVEYLAWAFDVRDQDAERWLRSTREEREAFFRPAKLRAAAQGKFRTKDYSYHCELGGHPVPGATVLFQKDVAGAQLMLSDLLGHVGRIWDHAVSWARRNSNGEFILERSAEMSARFAVSADGLSLASRRPPDRRVGTPVIGQGGDSQRMSCSVNSPFFQALSPIRCTRRQVLLSCSVQQIIESIVPGAEDCVHELRLNLVRRKSDDVPFFSQLVRKAISLKQIIDVCTDLVFPLVPSKSRWRCP